jgi:Prolyl oligopeptidase family
VTTTGRRNRVRLRDDAMQWELDRAIQETGRVQHFFDGRQLPKSVETHAMISKHLGKPAQRLEAVADVELERGHRELALELFFEAAVKFAQAQHPIFETNDEKRFLHASSIRCYDKVRRLAPTVIEHVDIPWRDTVVSGNLHLAAVEDPAPLVFFIPGCDRTKEIEPHPLRNWANQRGMHLFVFDGPGQGESNIRDIPLTVDNYEDAASTALTYLIGRSEVDDGRLAVYSKSFGSYWGARFAATDHRLAACVLQSASVVDKTHQFGGAVSPRYKQLFVYLTRSNSEEEVDAFIDAMTLDDLVGEIACPTLMTLGEFDPRSPLDEALEFFDALNAPSEFWVFADQHHRWSLPGSKSSTDHDYAMDWLRERFAGKPNERAGEVLYIDSNTLGPNDPNAKRKRRWFDR